MMNNKESYNIMDDLNNLKCSITVGQLLNACLMICSQLSCNETHCNNLIIKFIIIKLLTTTL